MRCIQGLDALDYQWTAFDLGGLGFGKPHLIQDETFKSRGFYKTSYKRRISRAMHKPQIITEFINSKWYNHPNELIVYLDADTFIRQRIDEVIGDYDIGVTTRRQEERKLFGKINAGVIFIRITEPTRMFLQRWTAETQQLGNDQEALASLLNNPQCSIREFPTEIYNWYYFPASPPAEAKILHFRAASRHHNVLTKRLWTSACYNDGKKQHQFNGMS